MVLVLGGDTMDYGFNTWVACAPPSFAALFLAFIPYPSFSHQFRTFDIMIFYNCQQLFVDIMIFYNNMSLPTLT